MIHLFTGQCKRYAKAGDYIRKVICDADPRMKKQTKDLEDKIKNLEQTNSKLQKTSSEVTAKMEKSKKKI